MISFQDFITEAQDYKAMFQAILDIDKSQEKTINDSISWAKRVLKKNDRIVWFLSYARLYVLFKMQDKELAQKYFDILNKKNPQWSKDYKMSDREFNNLKTQLEHFYSLNLKQIELVVLSNQTTKQVIGEFEELEDTHGYKEVEGTIPYKEDTVGEDINIVIDFKDGFYWVQLDRPYCKSEGDAMGHCGNTASWKSGDTILSLRKLIKRNPKDEASWLWEPHATFILDEDGMIGEMKGRGNEKPASKYHKYIVKLLEDTKLIKGIKGGGYAPQNNFDINDLSDSEKERLLKINPKLEIDLLDRLREIFDYGFDVSKEKEGYFVKSHETDSVVDYLRRVYYGDNESLDWDVVEQSLKGDWVEYDEDYPDFEHFYDNSRQSVRKYIDDIAKQSGWDDAEEDIYEFVNNNKKLNILEAIQSGLERSYQYSLKDEIVTSLKYADAKYVLDDEGTLSFSISDEEASLIVEEDDVDTMGYLHWAVQNNIDVGVGYEDDILGALKDNIPLKTNESSFKQWILA